MRPITLEQAEARGLLQKGGIHTWSNGTEWELWADGNCWECRFYSADQCGELCAFEGAALLDMVSPELAVLFGWVQRETKYGPLSGWDEPKSCPFFRSRTDDDGNETPLPPEPDPNQLVLLADPTEDAAMIEGPQRAEMPELARV